jgi:peptide/nickel transport system ATP-binding protein
MASLPAAKENTPPHTALLETQNLSVYFRTGNSRVKAVDNVSLRMNNNETVALVGETGCGKSVFGLSVLRLLPDNADVQGRLFFQGKDLLCFNRNEMRKIRGRKVALVPQSPSTSLNPLMRVGKQVQEAVLLHQRMAQSKAEKAVLKLLNDLKLPDAERRTEDYPHQFSGGMKQRVLIAMGIACRPELIVVDEPTKGLDAVLRTEVIRILKNLVFTTDAAMLLITHDFSAAAALSNRVAVMYAGEFVEIGATKEVLKNPLHPYTIGLLDSLPQRGLKPIPGFSPGLTDMPKGCRFNPRCTTRARQCRNAHPEMAQVGKEHYVRCFHAAS